METTLPSPAPSLTAQIKGFLRGAPETTYPNVIHSGTRLHAYGIHLATRLSATEVWVTPARLTQPAGQVRAIVRREAMLAGLFVYDGPKPPAQNPGFATIPPLTAADARIVALALRTLAVADAARSPARCERARRLAQVYDHAAAGEKALAAGSYAALPPSQEG